MTKKLSPKGVDFLNRKIAHQGVVPGSLKFTFYGDRVWAGYTMESGFVEIPLTQKEYKNLFK